MVISLTDTVGGLPFSGTDYNTNLATIETAFVNAVDLTAANTFTGQPNTFSGNPAATTQRGLVNLGHGGFAGGANHFVGSANGTLLAGNVPAAFTGNFLDMQVDGASRMSLTAAGLLTVTAVTAGSDFKVGGSVLGNNGSFGFGFHTATPGTDADVTLSPTEAGNALQRINTGAWTGPHNVIVPTETGGFFVIHNNSAHTATYKTAAGTGVAVAAGKVAVVFCGGANIVGGVFP